MYDGKLIIAINATARRPRIASTILEKILRDGFDSNGKEIMIAEGS